MEPKVIPGPFHVPEEEYKKLLKRVAALEKRDAKTKRILVFYADKN